MTTYAYTEILDLFQQLTPEEQVKLLEELEERINGHDKQDERRSIMESKGIAKDFWKDVDVEKYIDEERNSWAG